MNPDFRTILVVAPTPTGARSPYARPTTSPRPRSEAVARRFRRTIRARTRPGRAVLYVAPRGEGDDDGLQIEPPVKAGFDKASEALGENVGRDLEAASELREPGGPTEGRVALGEQTPAFSDRLQRPRRRQSCL